MLSAAIECRGDPFGAGRVVVMVTTPGRVVLATPDTGQAVLVQIDLLS